MQAETLDALTADALAMADDWDGWILYGPGMRAAPEAVEALAAAGLVETRTAEWFTTLAGFGQYRRLR